MLRVRLACVKHAASVRSEPGSNSRLKLVVPPIALSEENTMRENELFTSLGFHSKSLSESAKQASRNPFRANQTGSGMFHQIVKELELPGLQEGVQTNGKYS
jgi:hypothetical protein